MGRRTIVFLTAIILALALIVIGFVSLNNANKELNDRCEELKNELMTKETMLEDAKKKNSDIEKKSTELKENLDKYKSLIENIKPSLKYELFYGDWEVTEYLGHIAAPDWEGEEEIPLNLGQTLKIRHDRVEYREKVYHNPMYEYFVLPDDPWDRLHYRGTPVKDYGLKGPYYTVFYFRSDCAGNRIKAEDLLIEGFIIIDNNSMVMMINYGEYYLVERTAEYKDDYLETWEILP